jgi:putative sterol carrier protein
MTRKALFPTPDWMIAIDEKLNTDERYAQIARKWEGDLRFVIEPEGSLSEATWLYFDLWHGKCRQAYIEVHGSVTAPAFILTASYGNIIKVLSAEVGPMTALMGRMLKVKGNFAYLMRNVPTVLDFVRCCQEVTDSWI